MKDITTPLVVHDLNTGKKRSPFQHLIKLARRQAKFANTPTLIQAFNIIGYKALTSLSGKCTPQAELAKLRDIEEKIAVDTLNSEKAVEAVRHYQCDIVCLMGARILTRQTLDSIALPILNVHSSDPKFVRGGPPVFWEILDDRETIRLTIHKVVPELDAGGIIVEKDHPISWRRGLGATIQQTLSDAQDVIGDLFEAAIVSIAAGTVTPKTSGKGSIRVTPDFASAIKAERICRRRYKKG